MYLKILSIVNLMLLALTGAAFAAEDAAPSARTHIFALDDRAMPGAEPVDTVALRHARAEAVDIRHSADGWSEPHPLDREEDVWFIAIETLGWEPGLHEFKFLIDGEWEEGANRIIYINEDGVTAFPPALYLTWQRDPTTTMTVHWHSDHPDDPSVIHYRLPGEDDWRSEEGDKTPFPFTDRWIHTVELTGLTPDTRYEFRRDDTENVYAFQTMPDTLDEPLRFVAGGDIYHQKEWMDAMNRQAASLDPMFVAIGGDLAYADGLPENAGRWLAYFESFYKHLIAPDGRMIPQVVAIGNHEMQGHFLHWRDDYEPGPEWREYAAPYFFKLFAFPGHPGYNVLDFGDYMSIVFLDSLHLNFLTGEQLEWMQEVFADRADRPHLFPMYHVPAYPSHRNPDDYVNREIREHWVPVFEEVGVRLAFENHDHTFKVTHPIRDGEVDPDGIVYVGDGAWGVDTRPVDDWEDRWYLRIAEAVRHVFEIVIEPERRTVRALTVDGRVLDEFEQSVASPDRDGAGPAPLNPEP